MQEKVVAVGGAATAGEGFEGLGLGAVVADAGEQVVSVVGLTGMLGEVKKVPGAEVQGVALAAAEGGVVADGVELVVSEAFAGVAVFVAAIGVVAAIDIETA